MSDVIAGLINAVVSVPDGLASAALAGVNPVYGLYTSIAAPITGSLLVSARLMQIATTSAAALATSQAISGYSANERDNALFLFVVLAGIFLLLFGFLHLGRMVKFISFAVMTGFLTGVAVVLILSQAADLVGFKPNGGNEIIKFADLLRNVEAFDGRTIAIGLFALTLALGLQRTRLKPIASLVALIAPTLLVALVGWDRVQLVEDVAVIPRGIPTLTVPQLDLISLNLVVSAFALAVVIAVQGAGVSQSLKNPSGERISVSRDMIAEGAANVASGLLSGIPAGGSVGQTALNVSVGARSRWAGVFSGLFMLAIVLLVPDLVSKVPMAVLAALMIMAGISAIDLREAISIWETSGTARATILVTFLATLVLSVTAAVAVGVALSLVLFVMSAASDVRVREIVHLPDGRWADADPPDKLPSNAVTILDAQGSLFFAGARTLATELPSPADATHPAVVLRLRGRTRVGATLIEVLDTYDEQLRAAGGRLFLSGVHEAVIEQIKRSGKFDLDDELKVLPAVEVIGQSTAEAEIAAKTWLNRVGGAAGDRTVGDHAGERDRNDERSD